MMDTKNPATCFGRREAEYKTAGAMYLVPPLENINPSRLARRKRLLSLGVELHHRGSRPVGEFISELADISPEVADEIQARLETYCRIPAETYQALGGDTFSPYILRYTAEQLDEYTL